MHFRSPALPAVGGSCRAVFYAALIVVAATVIPSVNAQTSYPSKVVKVLVPYGAGGSADNAARVYAEGLSSELGQPFVIENRPGASGTLAAGMLAHAPADGYTLMVAPTAVVAITPSTRKTPYDPAKDFTAVAKLTSSYGMISMTQALPAKNLADFIELAKKHPGKYAFGSSGVGTITHLSGEVFQRAVGIELLHVPYKTIVDAVGDLFDGRIALVFDPFILPQISTGKVAAVAALGGQRHPDYPDVPTVEELGIDMKGFSTRSWFGMFAPNGISKEIVARLDAALEKVARDPETAKKLLLIGQRPDFEATGTFTPEVAGDLAFFKDLIAQLGLKLQN